MVQVDTVTLSLICLSQALAAEVAAGQTAHGNGTSPQHRTPSGGAAVSTTQK